MVNEACRELRQHRRGPACAKGPERGLLWGQGDQRLGGWNGRASLGGDSVKGSGEGGLCQGIRQGAGATDALTRCSARLQLIVSVAPSAPWALAHDSRVWGAFSDPLSGPPCRCGRLSTPRSPPPGAVLTPRLLRLGDEYLTSLASQLEETRHQVTDGRSPTGSLSSCCCPRGASVPYSGPSHSAPWGQCQPCLPVCSGKTPNSGTTLAFSPSQQPGKEVPSLLPFYCEEN